MKTRTVLSLGLSALVLGGSMTGCTRGEPVAAMGSGGESLARAKDEAKDARKALAKGKLEQAIAHAEAAAAMAPREAAYRALLGQTYLSAGRFTSAAQALGDALALGSTDGRAALNLALAQTALGDAEAARRTLAGHAERIDPSDRGLALALAGDPMGGVQVLTDAVRGGQATAKTRQNLALSLALAGRWQEARAIAGMDLPPAEADRRIIEWAAFARPKGAADQVAALLGVTPVPDRGQPVQLALSAPASPVASAAVDPVDAHMPPPISEAEVAAVAPELVAAAGQGAAPAGAAVTRFAARGEIVQPLPAGYGAPKRAEPPRAAVEPKPARKTEPAPRPLASGNAYVQLGAFDNAGVARDAWERLARRVAVLKGLTPQGVDVATRDGSFYRLSVGGFARADAERLCRAVKAKGGNCFVRPGVGEKTASWTRGPQVASRR